MIAFLSKDWINWKKFSFRVAYIEFLFHFCDKCNFFLFLHNFSNFEKCWKFSKVLSDFSNYSHKLGSVRLDNRMSLRRQKALRVHGNKNFILEVWSISVRYLTVQLVWGGGRGGGRGWYWLGAKSYTKFLDIGNPIEQMAAFNGSGMHN